MSNYETDIALWSEQQGALLRRRSMGELVNERELDWSNIAEEIEALSRSERAALRNHIVVVLEHLMKLIASPATAPRSGWMNSVRRARRQIKRCLKDSPSLRPAVSALIADEVPDAQEDAAAALEAFGEQPRVDIGNLTFSEDQVLGDWWPPAP